MCSKLPATCTFALFPILSHGYAHVQLSRVYLVSTFTASHVRINIRLSTPAQLQCSRSGTWEPGNEGRLNHKHSPVLKGTKLGSMCTCVCVCASLVPSLQFQADQPSAKQSSMMRVWSIFSGKMTGTTENILSLALG